MYREMSNEIEIEVEPKYLPEHSSPDNEHFLFAYRVRITNLGEWDTQLISRHWIITDGKNEVREVRGLGVIGKNPVIPPGCSFEYSSYCPLGTPTGNMRGSYRMVDENGHQYDVKIPLFFLRDVSLSH